MSEIEGSDVQNRIGKVESKVASIETDVHSTNNTLNKLFEKFDQFVEKSQPKPMSLSLVLGSTVAMLTIFALLFGSVIYIANSANAPLTTQMRQLTATMQTLTNNVARSNNDSRLIDKDLISIKERTEANAESLQWLINDKEITTEIELMKLKIEHMAEKFEREREK